MNKTNKLIVAGIILSVVFVFAYAGAVKADTTGSIIMNYDYNGANKIDCEGFTSNSSCATWSDGIEKSGSAAPGQFNFCLNSAVKYASGLSDVSGLQVNYEKLSKQSRVCAPDNAFHGTYESYRISFQPKCVSNATKQCVGNSVYNFDCGVQGSLFQACTSSQICQNAQCVNIVCSTNSQCGTNGIIGDPFCQGNNVYRNYKTYTCNNPGTANSYCSNSTAAQLQTNCTGNQICTNGSCNNQNIICSANSDCGTNGLVGSSYCQGNSIYQSYRTYICHNPGTVNSYCSNSANAQLQINCNYNQTCSNGSCAGNCALNYQQRCDGNSMYWYDSCGSRGNYIGACGNTGTLTVTKTVRNLTGYPSGPAGFATSTYANPSDVLMFLITLRNTGNQDVSNVVVRDALPANLVYNNQLVVARSNNAYGNYSGDVAYGINLNIIPTGQTVTISYQTQVAQATNFSYGTTTLNNNVSVTSSAYGYAPTASASVIVTRTAVLGVSSISTGLTNNFWVDSFFLPLLLTLIGIWLWRSGILFGVEKWIGNKKSEKELATKIANLRKLGKV